MIAEASRITLDRSWRQQLAEAGIFQKFSVPGPHVVYEGGALHSDTALNVHRLFSAPETLNGMCSALLRALPPRCSDGVSLVVSHPPYGEPIAKKFADLLGCKAVIVPDDPSDSPSTWSNSIGERVLVVTDEVLTGGRMTRLISFLDSMGVASGTHVIALADFGAPSLRLGRSVVSAISEKIPLWSPSDCPMCAAGSCGKRRIEL